MRNQIAGMSARRARVALLVAGFLSAVALQGCGEKPPACGDEQTVSVVRNIYQQTVEQAVASMPPKLYKVEAEAGGGFSASPVEPGMQLDKASLLQKIKAATQMQIATVTTASKDDQVGKLSCQAQMFVKIPASVAAMVTSPMVQANALGDTVPLIRSLNVSAEGVGQTIQYTSQLTDDKKQVSVTATGIEPVARLIASLAAYGLFDPISGSQSVAPASAPTPSVPAQAASATSQPSPQAASPIGASEPVATVETTPTSPSFSCSGKLSTAEKLICDTPSLAQADAALARAYSATLARASDAALVKQQQRSWRSTRDACADVACMEAAYSNRTAELSR